MKFTILILIVVLLTQCSTIKVNNEKFILQKTYYAYSYSKGKILKLDFESNADYTITPSDCYLDYRYGVYKRIKKKIILYDDNFYAAVWDTLYYKTNTSKLYSKEIIFDSNKDSIEYRKDKEIKYYKMVIEKLFNCEDVIIELRR